jgi:hypothetical protein
MDEIKLTEWRERFEQNAKDVEIEYNAFFLNQTPDSIYSINLNESHEWQIQINEKIPNEIKRRLEQIFLEAKPEDSI